MSEVPYVRHPTEFPVRYAHGPDSFPQPGVPRGELHEHEWVASEGPQTDRAREMVKAFIARQLKAAGRT